MLFFREPPSDFALVVSFGLFVWINLHVGSGGVVGVGDSLYRLCGSFPSRHGSVVWWCACVRLDMFGSLFRATGCTVIHPSSLRGDLWRGKKDFGMRRGRVMCSRVLRSVWSGRVIRWVARVMWSWSCHPLTFMQNSVCPPSVTVLDCGLGGSGCVLGRLFGVCQVLHCLYCYRYLSLMLLVIGPDPCQSFFGSGCRIRLGRRGLGGVFSTRVGRCFFRSIVSGW